MDKEEPVEFTLVTYNIDGRKLHKEERLKAFLEKISLSPPDVIVIQEGTRIVYEKLLREMKLMGYERQFLDIMNSRATGELIFSKFPMEEVKYFSFRKSTENRGISAAKISVGDHKLWICTSQFDNQTSFYRMQTKDFSSLIRHIIKDNIVIFAGDTRILEYQADLFQPENWEDAWYECGSEENRYTYNSKTNLLTKPPYKDRPDRVWYYSPVGGNNTVECLDFKLYGHDNLTTISSHYGVWTKFRLS